MPEVGEIRRGHEIGRRNSTPFIWQACIRCGKERWVAYGLKRAKPVTIRCLSCANSTRNGRRETCAGYVQLHLKPDDFFYSMTDKDSYVYEHRLIVAKALGRCLHSWEIVHHKGVKYPIGRIIDTQRTFNLFLMIGIPKSLSWKERLSGWKLK